LERSEEQNDANCARHNEKDMGQYDQRMARGWNRLTDLTIPHFIVTLEIYEIQDQRLQVDRVSDTREDSKGKEDDS